MAVATVTRRDAVPQRGSAVNRRLRTDRDGDVSMDAGPAGSRVRGGGISKSKGRGGPARSGSGPARAGSGPSRGGPSTSSGRDIILSSAAQQRILRQAAEGSIRGPKLAVPNNLKEIKVTGWKNSKAASGSKDGGVSSLVSFLERKAARTGPAIKIKRYRVNRDVLLVYATEENAEKILTVNNFTFAGASLKIEASTSRSNSPSMDDATTQSTDDSQTTADMKELLLGVLQRRYNADHKLLNLSELDKDESLSSLGIFNDSAAESKFFPALMKICDMQFKTAQEKENTIQSVVLSNNGLSSVRPVTTVASTFPHLKNLDLSNNRFEELRALEPWKHKFRHLDHLIVTNNPLEQKVPNYNVELVKWYPTLRLLNNITVRSDAEAAAGGLAATKNPPATKGPIFLDEAQIAENFLKTFFAGFDADRAILANMYYDAQSTFSLSVNTHSVRDPKAEESDKPQPQEWDSYIKKSRNLKKLTYLNARMNRLCRGPDAIRDIWQQLPTTKHPDFVTNQQNWLMECRPQPNVPDPTGQSPNGVNGFLITVHGEFYEINPKNGERKHRSFDRTFILGPGGSTGVRVVSDLWVVRAYGGYAAWQAGLSPEQQQEAMAVEVTRLTGMKPDFSKQCLVESGWDIEKALLAFNNAKASLPKEAFL